MNKSKACILADAGYVPRRGRPRFSDEPMGTVWARVPVSVIKLIPEPRSDTLRALIMRKYPAKAAPKRYFPRPFVPGAFPDIVDAPP